MLGLLVALVFTFTLVGTVNAAQRDFTVTTDNGSVYDTDADFTAAYGNIGTAKSAVIELNADVTSANLGALSNGLLVGSPSSIEQTITIRLNGHTLDLGTHTVVVFSKATLNIVGSGEVKTANRTSAMFDVRGGGKLNVTNGVTITYSPTAPDPTSAVVSVSGAGSNFEKTVVMFSNDTNVEATAGNGVIVNDNATYATVTIAGEWNVTHGSFAEVTGSGSKNLHAPVINFVSGGIYSAKNTGIDIRGYAVVNVKGGTFTSETSDVISQASKSVLNITGGNFTTEATGSYALDVAAVTSTDSDAKNTQFYISAGTFKSGEDASADEIALLPAINISSEKVLNANAGHVTGGVFYSNIGNYILSTEGTNGQFSIATVSNTLTKGATATSSNGKVTVKAGSAATDPEQKPDDKPNTGDNQPAENPKTFDAIGSLVALAVSSLGVVGTATKKVLK